MALKRIHLTEQQFRTLLSEASWAFHSGKDHDGTPYKSENRYMCYHETGQFGSGTYFSTYNTPYEHRDYMSKYGDDIDPEKENFVEIGDGVYRVNMSLYQNLYRVYSEQQGDVLHTMLGDLNGFFGKISSGGDNTLKNARYDNARLYQRISANARYLRLKCPSYMELTRMAQKHTTEGGKQSFSTVFMEYNGFNGVNVSGIGKFDNSKHGSVIYDLSKVSNDIVEVGPAEKGYIGNVNGGSHTNSVAYNLIGSDSEKAKADSLKGDVPYYDINEKDTLRVVKNLVASGREFDLDAVVRRYGKSRHVMSYLLKMAINGKINQENFLTSDKICDYIVSNNLYQFLDYEVNTYLEVSQPYRYQSFLIKFLEKYYWEADTPQEREAYCNKLISMMHRPLSKREQLYVSEYVED